MVTRDPSILVAHSEKTVLPKLEFFHSIGMPPHDIALVTSRTPRILRCSLENCIIPFYGYLKNLLQSDEKAITVLKQARNFFLQVGLRQLPPNVAILKKYGVNESIISSLTVHYPESLMMRSDDLVKIVNRVIELGMDVSKYVFVRAINVLHCMSKSTWEARKNAYHKWGWSESDIHMAFSIQPECMRLSEKKLMSVMEFCVNEMNCEAKAIARHPTVLLYSLEKRIMPRCRVVKLLMVKGLIEGPYNLVSLLVMTDKTFSERFVMKYDSIPGLLDVYHGKLSLQDLGIDSSELAKAKLV
ncbi:hypothetical protein CDL12_24139 [Handroanthus impetiginosus]|uniref:Mitochondrial transcription termination factor, mTERF n=1 Tax=Handroanthus impetiginosus TaxID=429701 RepID=A0A2G9GDH6_9LAMI|nr:hypothetical protein CDL12_24139 [Handroanthus impetiginosus]